MEEEQKFEVRDLRTKEKFSIDDRFLNSYAKIIGVYGVAIYASLCRHVNKEQKCFPSQRIMAEKLSISQPTIIEYLKVLKYLKIIKKVRVGRMANNRYYLLDKKYWRKDFQEMFNELNSNDIKEFNITTKRVLVQNLKSFISNIKDIHIKDTYIKDNTSKDVLEKNKVSFICKYTQEDLKLAELLYNLIKEKNPAWYVKPDWDKWAEDIRRLREIDKRTPEQIEFMIRWCQQDEFWCKNILSPSKLRKQFNNLVVKVKSQRKDNKIGIAM